MKKCSVFDKCGGCSYINLLYKDSLKIKKEKLIEAFKAVGITTNEIIADESPYGYRLKVVATALMQNDRLKFGLYEERSKKVIAYDDCLIQDELINRIIVRLESILNKYKIGAYDFKLDEGILKHVLFRKSYAKKEVLVVFVTNGYLFPKQKLIVNELIREFKEIKTVVQNIWNKRSKLVLSNSEKILYGSGYIEDEIAGIIFKLSARSFYQINPKQAITLYSKALSLIDNNLDVVIDCYCGIGTISLLASKRSKKVLAIEINDSAINDAIANKKRNNIRNVDFIKGDVFEVLDGYSNKVDLLIVDPTRSGLDTKFIKLLLKIKPKQILYISCDYQTQIRDYLLLKGDCKVANSFAIDMFPFTEHIESCLLLNYSHDGK